MFRLVKPNKIGSSSAQVDILDVVDGILRLTSNRYRLILKVSSINFELKSEEEQDAIIDTYEGFLNAISFPLQILLRTREINMDDYLNELKNKQQKEAVEIYKKALGNYYDFIRSLVADNKILSRQFYIVLPFEPTKNMDFRLVSEQLSLRADIVSKNLSRLGISCSQLSSVEVVDLFYKFYSPLTAKLQPLSERALSAINSGFVISEQNNV
jgi:hypothetical protein